MAKKSLKASSPSKVWNSKLRPQSGGGWNCSPGRRWPS
jgi:hypothetical protein